MCAIAVESNGTYLYYIVRVRHVAAILRDLATTESLMPKLRAGHLPVIAAVAAPASACWTTFCRALAAQLVVHVARRRLERPKLFAADVLAVLMATFAIARGAIFTMCSALPLRRSVSSLSLQLKCSMAVASVRLHVCSHERSGAGNASGPVLRHVGRGILTHLPEAGK